LETDIGAGGADIFGNRELHRLDDVGTLSKKCFRQCTCQQARYRTGAVFIQ
jgi:hypothetical protein